jgi:hypothetical protein
MKSIAITAALALATSFAVAQDKKDQVSNRSAAPHNETMPGTAGDYWGKHAKDGYITRDQALNYKPADGKAMDWKRMDADSDGKVSQMEWKNYHGDKVENRSEAPNNATMPNAPKR